VHKFSGRATTKETSRPRNKAWPAVGDVVMKSVYIRDMQIGYIQLWKQLTIYWTAWIQCQHRWRSLMQV